MNKILKIQEEILNLIYPQKCGICGKLAPNSLCKKCEIELKKQSDVNIIQQEKEYNNHYCLFRYSHSSRGRSDRRNAAFIR